MFITKSNPFLFLLCCLFLKSRGLERLTLIEDDIILATESAIRNITNNLFIALNLRGIKLNPKLRQSALVHNFFTSVTLKDHKILSEIVVLSRINENGVSNETKRYANLINEILNEDWNGVDGINPIASDEDIIQYVDEFLTNIDGFKENSGINDKYASLEIKDELLHILQSNDSGKYMSPRNGTTAVKFEDYVLSDSEFWVPEQKTRRIYRGDKTKIKYFPFMASIQIFNSFQCAGSIIKSDLILTAASCLQLAWNNRFFRENPAFLSARVGSNFYNGGGENIPVLEVYFHPDYNPKNLRHNLALCRLVRHLKFRKRKRRLKKIDIDTYSSALSMTTDGITIVGWGARGTSNIVHDPWSNQLAFAVLDVYHLQECQEIYSREYVTTTNFCAGFISKGGGACNRDVGGPGIVSGKLAGVVSFGSPVCGTPDAPTVFTKVGYYADWIEEIMEQNVPHIKIRTTGLPQRMPLTLPHLVNEKRTTFKLSPIVAKPTPKPIPIQQIDGADNLRILEDEDLFNDFLSTIFGSKEAIEYRDLLIAPGEKSKSSGPGPFKPKKLNTRQKIKTQEQKPGRQKIQTKPLDMYDGENANEETFATEPPGIDSEMDSSAKVTINPEVKYTVMDENLLPNDNELIEKNIAKLINNIEVGSTEDDDDTSSNSQSKEVEENYEQVTVGPEKPNQNFVEKMLRKKDDENVLTLLYISDSERGNATSLDTIGNIIDDFDDNDGLSISMDGFKDMTFRHNKSSALDFMSRSELYDLLSEAIDEVAKDKNI